MLLSLQGLANSLSTNEAGGTDGAVFYMVGNTRFPNIPTP